MYDRKKNRLAQNVTDVSFFVVEAIGLSFGYWNSRWGKGRIKRGKKMMGLDLFIKGMNVKHPPHGCLELA